MAQFPRSSHIFCAFCPVPSLLLLWTVLLGPRQDLWIYFRMHLFVVKFSLFSSPRVCLDPPNQNPADALVIRVCGDSSSHTVLVSWCAFSLFKYRHWVYCQTRKALARACTDHNFPCTLLEHVFTVSLSTDWWMEKGFNRHKMGHFGDVLPSQSLRSVLEKPNPTKVTSQNMI